jgi:signal transduction histidine kinase
MFGRARRRLTLLYIGLFAVVLGVFSAVFYVGFSTVLAPTFDIAPELTNEQVAEVAYQATIDRIGLALLVADVVVIALVGVAAWTLASWTLRPIRDAHLRQRAFVAHASHEMRTPLTAIRSTAEGALMSPGTTDDWRRAVAAITTSAESLSRLTNDLLLLARADDGLIAGRPEKIDLSVVVVEAIEAIAVTNPGLAPPNVVLAPDIRIDADADEIRRIVANLIDNAYRYGGTSVSVRVATLASEREGIVEVHDDGHGIAAADLERIFEPFYRVRADAAGPAGSGLGLAIARSLAERNHGRLEVISRPAAGATFRLALPRFR